MRPRIALTVSRLDIPDPRTRELRRRARVRYATALASAGAEVIVQSHPERTDEAAPEAWRIFAAFVAAASRSPAPAR